MNAMWCNTFSETQSGAAADEGLFGPRTETSSAFTLDERGVSDSWLMERWRAAAIARTETAWAFMPADIIDELEAGTKALTSDDIYWLVDVALGADPVRSVAALRVLSAVARIDASWAPRFAPIFAEALRSSFGRVRSETAELIWASRMTQCSDALQHAAEREPPGHARRTMEHAMNLLRGKSGDSQ
jgi:hypothetical protein